MKRFIALLPLSLLALLAIANEAKQPSPTEHTAQKMEGWTIQVDSRLLDGQARTEGEKALKLLNARLVAITHAVPEPALSKLRAVTIQLDLSCGDLRSMQYHPSAAWLKDNGYSEKLAKRVHLPDAAAFLSPFDNRRMPWSVLHELAHAYHDQVLGFDEPRITAAWEKFRSSGKYKSTLTSYGATKAHYGLTNAKEFFAEMTEAYFGSNDFYPFVAGELQRDEPEIYALMESIWGRLPN